MISFLGVKVVDRCSAELDRAITMTKIGLQPVSRACGKTLFGFQDRRSNKIDSKKLQALTLASCIDMELESV